MELLILALFSGALLLCIILHISLLPALTFGLVLFLLYGRHKGFSWQTLRSMALSGVRTVRGILLTFLLIGMLTALWRAAGTVPMIVCCAARLIRPSLFLLMTFLLNSVLSLLTGTSFGTSATMGVICAAIGAALQIPPVLTGGAVLAGAFFGDRCSPVSTSALLVATLTGTDLFQNIRAMLRTAAVPFLVTCVLYALLGLGSGASGTVPDLQGTFSPAFRLHWVTLLPAAVILVLSLLRMNVRRAMCASILTALPICLIFQHLSPAALPGLLVWGYHSSQPAVAALLNGGGIVSMLNVSCIVCLSSSYSGLFRETGLLDSLQSRIRRLSGRTSPYAAMLATSVLTGMIACNQTLTIMLCHQLCQEEYRDDTTLALHLEDTAVLVTPLIPWSIAGSVPLTMVGAPAEAIFFAFFLYLVPLRDLWKTRRSAPGPLPRPSL